MKSGSTFVIFWCWRLLNGVSLINTAYLVIVYDRLWVTTNQLTRCHLGNSSSYSAVKIRDLT